MPVIVGMLALPTAEVAESLVDKYRGQRKRLLARPGGAAAGRSRERP